MRPGKNMHWKTRRVGQVTVSVKPKPRTPYTILQVKSLIDTGRGAPSIILQNALPDAWEIDLKKPKPEKEVLSLPCKIGDLNCVYTGRSFGVVADIVDSIKAVTGNAKIATIVPDVIAPGDFVIFKHSGPDYKIRFAGVLRALPKRKEKLYKTGQSKKKR